MELIIDRAQLGTLTISLRVTEPFFIKERFHQGEIVPKELAASVGSGHNPERSLKMAEGIFYLAPGMPRVW